VVSLCLLQGMSCAFIGPCLRDLQYQTNTTLGEISRLFVSRASGSVVGSLLSIYVVTGTKWPSVIPVSLFILAASLAIVPWCSSLTVLLASFSVQGLATGLIATSQSHSVDSVFVIHRLLFVFCIEVYICLSFRFALLVLDVGKCHTLTLSVRHFFWLWQK